MLNVDSGARLGQLEGLRGVHGVEIVKSPLQAFATNGLDRTVTMFDPVTLSVTRNIKYAGVKNGHRSPRVRRIRTWVGQR